MRAYEEKRKTASEKKNSHNTRGRKKPKETQRKEEMKEEMRKKHKT